MVTYFGMSELLPNISYYDSTGQNYGFTKPYSETRAKVIDDEVSRIIAEQYERAKQILRNKAAGHNELTEVLLSREVIFTEDVERIFGKRPWTSRTEEILSKDDENASVVDANVEVGGQEHADNDADYDAPSAASDSKEVKTGDSPVVPPPFPPVDK